MLNSFYHDAKKELGFINLTENSLFQYCEYLNRNLKYRACNKSTSLTRNLHFSSEDYKHNSDPLQQLKGEGLEVSNLRDLESEKQKKYDFMEIFAHSASTNHGVYIENEYDHISLSDVENFKWTVNFYLLFACNASERRLFGWKNLARTYLSKAGGGALAVIAHTNGAGLMNREKFYKYLGNGATFGEAIIGYLNNTRTEELRPRWHVGLILNGDPSLTLHRCE